MKRVIDATNLIVGRLASYVAKRAILGEEFVIINSDKAIVTGNKKQIFAKYRRFREMGTPTQGPYIKRKSRDIIKRMVRGMVPYKQAKGREALERVKCFNAIPKNLKEKPETIEHANVSKVPNTRFITLKKVSEFMGAK